MRALELEDTPLVALRSRRVEVLSRLLVPGTVMYQENRSRNLYIAMCAGLHRPRSLTRQFCLLLLPALMSCRQNSGSRTRRMLSECGGTWDMNGDVSFRIHSSWFSDVSKLCDTFQKLDRAVKLPVIFRHFLWFRDINGHLLIGPCCFDLANHSAPIINKFVPDFGCFKAEAFCIMECAMRGRISKLEGFVPICHVVDALFAAQTR